MQTGNAPNNRNAANDIALPMELIESMECFVFKGDRDSVDQNINAFLVSQSNSQNKNVHSLNTASKNLDPPADQFEYECEDEIVTYTSPISRNIGRISNTNRTSTDNSARLETRTSRRLSKEFESIYSLNHHNLHNNGSSQVSPFPLVEGSGTSSSVSNMPLSRSDSTSQHVFNCSICLSDYQMNEILLRLPCFHIYHKNCVAMWFQQHNTCPLCKQNVSQMMIEQQNDAHNIVSVPLDHSNTTNTSVNLHSDIV